MEKMNLKKIKQDLNAAKFQNASVYELLICTLAAMAAVPLIIKYEITWWLVMGILLYLLMNRK